MLDPERVKLDAAHIGFLVRTGQKVDMDKVKMFLQTDDSGVINVRRTVETPVNELHVMGGQRYGMEGNMNLQEYSRQARQINGYPLRSFSATAPAVILPPKYGGFPRYVENEGERTDYVSRFTEPISAALQQNTILLGREGYTVSNNSASDPFIPMGFDMNMFKSKDAIDQNEYQHSMRRYLERVENQRIAKSGRGGGRRSGGSAGPFGDYKGGAGPTGMGGIGGDQLVEGSQIDKKDLRGSFKGGMGRRLGVNDGVFIGANGNIMTQVSSVTNNAYMTSNVFNNYQSRQNAYFNFQAPPDQNDAGLYNVPSNQGAGLENRVGLEVLEDNQNLDMYVPNENPMLNNQEIVQQNYFTPPPKQGGPTTGMQPMSLAHPGKVGMIGGVYPSESEGYVTAKDISKIRPRTSSRSTKGIRKKLTPTKGQTHGEAIFINGKKVSPAKAKYNQIMKKAMDLQLNDYYE